jgi:uncharacterized protein involved in exopolysaccharide biosynthesis
VEQRSLYLIRQALTAVFKRRRMVFLLFFLVFVPANLGNMMRDPVFRANGKVLIKIDRAYPEVSPLPRQSNADRPPNEAMINSEIQLIKSRELLRRVQVKLSAAAAESDEPRRVPGIQALESKLQVTRKPNSNVLQLSFASSDPDEAIQVVNSVMTEYVAYNIETHNDSGALRFFAEQTDSARESYEESDVALERYDAAHGLTSVAVEKDQLLRQRAQLEADLRRTEAQITEETTKVAALEAELEYIPEHEATDVDVVPNPMLNYLNQNLSKLEMERTKLLGLYTAQHRLVMDIDAEIAALRQQVLAQEPTVVGRKRMATTVVRRELEQQLLGAQADLGALEARRAMLTERISDYDSRIRVMHSKHYQVMRLRRDRTEKKALYDALIAKLGQLEVSAAMDRAGLSNVAVIEAAAAPLMRDPDFKGVTFVLSFFAALLISIGSAVVTEMLNPVMNSDIDVRHHLGLPVLAEIPLNGIDTGNGYSTSSGPGAGPAPPRRTEIG